MEIALHSLQIKRTAHVYSSGNKDTAQNLWIVCHGYGQQADQLLQSFEVLDSQKHLVVAPEGLSKFYWKGFSGDPVASWMTRRHRLDEIEDFCNYLDQVYQYWTRERSFKRIILFGFSQGCATVWRWMHARQPEFDIMMNWAGNIPEDISYHHLSDYLKSKSLYFVWGRNDPYLDAERIRQIQEVIRKNKLDIHFSEFQGEHIIDKRHLQFLTREIRG